MKKTTNLLLGTAIALTTAFGPAASAADDSDARRKAFLGKDYSPKTYVPPKISEYKNLFTYDTLVEKLSAHPKYDTLTPGKIKMFKDGLYSRSREGAFFRTLGKVTYDEAKNQGGLAECFLSLVESGDPLQMSEMQKQVEDRIAIANKPDVSFEPFVRDIATKKCTKTVAANYN